MKYNLHLVKNLHFVYNFENVSSLDPLIIDLQSKPLL